MVDVVEYDKYNLVLGKIVIFVEKLVDLMNEKMLYGNYENKIR